MGSIFLDKLTIHGQVAKYISNIDTTWQKEGHAVRKARFKHLLPTPWTPPNYTRWEDKMSILNLKYGAKKLKDFPTQRALYWLSVDQILPRPQPFRQRIQEEHGIDWHAVDKLKLFASSKMQAYIWRSTHGKLFGRSDLFRFNYVLDAHCGWCNNKKQSIEHIYTACPRIQGIFSNFNRQYKLEISLSTAEMLMGVDSNLSRSKITLKRLNLLRKYIYDCAHQVVVPKWEEVLHRIDMCYVIEYAIAERNGTVYKVLREWEL
jgi:hypothetical protein